MIGHRYVLRPQDGDSLMVFHDGTLYEGIVVGEPLFEDDRDPAAMTHLRVRIRDDRELFVAVSNIPGFS